jgi:archaetidylinositol phosphate synthase
MLKQNAFLRGVQGGIGKILAAIPLSPNNWTVLSFLIAVAGGVVIAFYDELLVGLALFAVAAVFDLIDGAVARARGEVTKLGGFIDGVADRFVEAIFLFSLMFYPLPTVFIEPAIWLAAVIFLGTCMPSFVRAYSDHKGVLSKEKALALGGICERSERLSIIIIGLAAGLLYGMELFVYSLILVSALSLLTVIQRFLNIMKNQPKV